MAHLVKGIIREFSGIWRKHHEGMSTEHLHGVLAGWHHSHSLPATWVMSGVTRLDVTRKYREQERRPSQSHHITLQFNVSSPQVKSTAGTLRKSSRSEC